MLINCEDSDQWSVTKRFSAFVDLRKSLAKGQHELPTLPPKTWTRRPKDQELIAVRRKGLTTFMNQLCQIEYAIQSPEFIKFLEINKHIDVPSIKPLLIKTIPDPQFAVNDFLYDEENSIMFTVCEDIHSVSVMDSKISNIKVPGKKEDTLSAIGSFNCWTLDDNQNWEVSCTLSFDIAATVLEWEAERRYAIIGLANGQIMFYFTENYEKFTLVYDLRVHNERVTGLVYNNTRDVLISCARDKKFNIYDLRKERSICNVKAG